MGRCLLSQQHALVVLQRVAGLTCPPGSGLECHTAGTKVMPKNAAAVALLWVGPPQFGSAAAAAPPFGAIKLTVERLAAQPDKTSGPKKKGGMWALRAQPQQQPQMQAAHAAAAKPAAAQPKQQQPPQQQGRPALWPIFNCVAKKRKL